MACQKRLFSAESSKVNRKLDAPFKSMSFRVTFSGCKPYLRGSHTVPFFSEQSIVVRVLYGANACMCEYVMCA
jgi:hypothetical protein